MIYYNHLPLDKDILKALGELSINYAFQPIFYPDGKTVFAWEALMRPTEMTVTELIEKYTQKDKLHILEADAFLDYFGQEIRGRMIVENLEYPYFSIEHWKIKSESVRYMDNLLAVDDFGSGINNLERVGIMSPDIVKLDRELISGIDHIPEKQERVKQLVPKFHSGGFLVVAEGVEEKAEFDYLLGQNIDLYQGYYLARPQ